MKGWGGVGWCGWIMKGWGGVCHEGGGVGWVMKGWGRVGVCHVGVGVGWVKTQTQKIITHRVSKIHK